MSHITKYELKIDEPETLKSVIEELNATQNFKAQWLGKGTEKSYSRSTTGWHFRLNGWSYPVCVTEDGSLEFDNYNGSWGKEDLLDKVVQAYQKTVLLKRARQQGWMPSESVNSETGEITLTLMR